MFWNLSTRFWLPSFSTKLRVAARNQSWDFYHHGLENLMLILNKSTNYSQTLLQAHIGSKKDIKVQTRQKELKTQLRTIKWIGLILFRKSPYYSIRRNQTWLDFATKPQQVATKCLFKKYWHLNQLNSSERENFLSYHPFFTTWTPHQLTRSKLSANNWFYFHRGSFCALFCFGQPHISTVWAQVV